MGKILKIILFVFGVVKTWSRGKTNPAEIIKLQQKVDEITNEQAKILDTKPFDYRRYHELDGQLSRLNRKISRLQTE